MKLAISPFVILAAGLSFAAPAQAATAVCNVNQAGLASLTGIPDQDLVSLLRASPEGGRSLVKALAEILEADPARAAEVVALAARANPEQKASIAEALVLAAKTLRPTNPAGATQIRAATRCADPALRSAIAAWDARSYASSSNNNGGNGVPFQPMGLSGGFTGGGGVVSPH